MKCTYHWLKEFVDFDFSASELAEKLTILGLEVDVYETVKRDLQNAVIGQVVDRTDWEHYSINIGDQEVEIESTSNLKNGQNIVVNSENGKHQIATYNQLNISDDQLPIYVEDHLTAGTKLSEIIPETDVVYDIDLTPNRPDCLSIIGIANEIATITGNKLRFPKIEFKESETPALDYIKISIDSPEGCPRYAARMMKNISIRQSPLWIHDRLTKVGLRAINNVVDVTNYVMMEIGHPLHAFDYSQIQNQEIRIRLSKHGEHFVTLDEKGHTLDDRTVLICDGKQIVALGGIMGGLNSEVSNSTKDLLLECAYFNPIYIRKSARKLGIISDASMRFSRGADPNDADWAINRTAQLIAATAGGEILNGIVDEYVAPIEKLTIPLRIKRIETLLGTNVTSDQVCDTLENLGCEVSNVNSEKFEVTVPTFRPDLVREIDLVEEISRIVGFDKIPEKINTSYIMFPNVNWRERYLKQIREYWIGNGFSEAISNSMISLSDISLEFYSDETIKLQNPLSEDMAILRPSMIPSLLRIAQYNLFRQQENIRLFEIGNTFQPNGKSHHEDLVLAGIIIGNYQPFNWKQNSTGINYFELKGLLSGFFKKLGISNFQFETNVIWAFEEPNGEILFNGKNIGFAGSIKKEILDKYDISTECYIFELKLNELMSTIKNEKRFKPVPRFPSVQRDLAFVIDLDTPGGMVLEEIKKWGGTHLIDLNIFDVYTGKQVPVGKKSVAVSLLFQDELRTLTETEINEMVDQIITNVKKSLKAELRS